MHLHAKQIDEFGGEGGLLDEGLVSSAVAAPQNQWLYTGCTVFDLAASYAFHISKNHGFNDGNKRTGAACAVVFLRANGWIVTRGFEHEMLAVVAGRMSQKQFAGFLKSNCRRSFFGAIAELFGS